MFSMPAPIPPPPGDFASATKRFSPTATIPFPTHLSITTPFSSRIIGDWGFKRPLPLKTTTKTTIPLVRVRQVDSIEHVTDFQSASDHTLTLKKFQELHLPITAPVDDLISGLQSPMSVFEEDSDVTAIPEEKKEELENKRWRFKGPWLAGMTDGAFEKYLEKEVRGRRTEFRVFLRKRLAAEMTKDQAREASEKVIEAPEPVSADDITERQFAKYVKQLRNDPVELYQLVGRFLDLAPLSKVPSPSEMRPYKQYTFTKPSPYSNNGPPITHPSAGLSYLRTRYFQEHHPLYGPQLKHPPVEARVLAPRHASTGNQNAVIGVAGFITKPVAASLFNARGQNKIKGKELYNLDLETPGGTKKFSDIQDAFIDATGKLVIRVDSSTSTMAELIQKEMMGRARVYEDALKRTRMPVVPQVHRRDNDFRRGPAGVHRFGNSQSYGFGRRSDFGREH